MPETLPTRPCRGCGKPILWGLTPDGKRIPLDPVPAVYHYLEGSCQRLPDAYVIHFATCKNANDYSRSNRAAP